MAKLTTIEGIGPSLSTKLKRAGVGSTESLLKYCSHRQGRQEVARAAGITPTTLLKFVNHADLMRIRGIGGEYAELLEASGVDSVKELARRDVKSLYTRVVEVNNRRSIVRQLPSQKMVSGWIGAARRMKTVVTH